MYVEIAYCKYFFLLEKNFYLSPNDHSCKHVSRKGLINGQYNLNIIKQNKIYKKAV